MIHYSRQIVEPLQYSRERNLGIYSACNIYNPKLIFVGQPLAEREGPGFDRNQAVEQPPFEMMRRCLAFDDDLGLGYAIGSAAVTSCTGVIEVTIPGAAASVAA